MELTRDNASKARELFGEFLLTTKSNGKWGKDLRFIAEFLSAAERHLAEPSVQANITFVEYGYQIDVLLDGEEAGTVCRDFSGSYPIEDMSVHLAARLFKVMQGFERDFRSQRKVIG